MDSASSGPPGAVLAAFGVTGAAVVLPGGKGGTWRAGDVVLKPVEFLPETLWRAEIIAGLVGAVEIGAPAPVEQPTSGRFRLARPVPAVDGAWVAGGWEAAHLVAGQPDPSRPDDIVRAGHAFHAAIAEVSRPAFLDRRADAWALGDRVAWAELPAVSSPAAMRLLRPLLRARRPVRLAAQAVHGDLPGNVLFAAGLSPAIIDWSVYWRPAAWASAVVVVDAMCWYGATPDLAARWSHLPAWGQLLARALIYRIVTHDALRGAAGWTPDQIGAYGPAVDVALGFADPG